MSTGNPLTPSSPGERHEYPLPSSPRRTSSRSPRGDNVRLEGSGRHSLRVSFDENLAQTFRRSNPRLRVSFAPSPDTLHRRGQLSPLIPQDVFTPQTRQRAGEPTFEARLEEAEDPSRTAMLIYPKKIDDLRRFRLVFVGLLLFVVSSTQGVHSLFGTVLMQGTYGYNVHQMTCVYLCGSAFGMFVWPFGALYDCFGPRPAIAIATILVAVGDILLALMFWGKIDHTVVNSCIFYAIMSWGCYGLDVVTLPAVLTHMPRNRGQPTGLLKTFSGLGSSLLSCLFRGFFNNHYEHLMWFMLAFTIVFGAIGTWYIEDAPYVANRWQQRRLTPRTVLRNYLVRNRYMTQFIPRRRYSLVIVVMVLLNFYLTIQAVVVAFRANDMTKGKYRGVAIGAILVTALMLVLVIPIRAIDGISPQDKEVIESAKRKEEELQRRREARRAKAEQEQADHFHHTAAPRRAGGSADISTAAPSEGKAGRENSEHVLTPVDVPEPCISSRAAKRRRPSNEPNICADDGDTTEVHVLSLEDSRCSENNSSTTASRGGARHPQRPERGTRDTEPNAPAAPPRSQSTTPQQQQHRLSESAELSVSQRQRRGFDFSLTWRRMEPVPQPRPIIEMHLEQDQDARHTTSLSEDLASSSSSSASSTDVGESGNRGAHTDTPQEGNSPGVSEGCHAVLSSTDASPLLTASFAYAPFRGTRRAGQAKLEVSTRDHSTYNKPYFETINVCGEVFVTPVYQTTFFESLTYFDLWLIFYTTLVVWGVGLTMTANWNIQVMVQARWLGMDYKMYILFAAMSGIATAGGRVFVGVYEQLLEVLREKCNVDIVPTLAYPLASIGLLISMIFWIALPGDKVLVLAYILGPAFYGISTSFTPYILGTIYDRDMGMHYGFIFLGAAIGQVFFFYLSWFLPYDEAAVMFPGVGKRCMGMRKCMNKAVGIYIAVVFSSIFTSWFVHMRYARLVAGNLKHRRVIKYAVKRVLGQASSDDSNTEAAGNQAEKDVLSATASAGDSAARAMRPHSSAGSGSASGGPAATAPQRDDTSEGARLREPLYEDQETQRPSVAGHRTSRTAGGSIGSNVTDLLDSDNEL